MELFTITDLVKYIKSKSLDVLKVYLIAQLVVTINPLYAQYSNNKWCFGDSAGIYFHNGALTNFTSSVKNRGSCVSICDSNDSLLIYASTTTASPVSNSTRVWNRFDSLVVNGTNIIGEDWYNELQLLPDPSNDSLLYLFSIGVNGISPYGLYYSIINYKQNQDSGIVIQKNSPLLIDPAFDCLSAVKHANGKDWWLIFQKWGPTFQDSSNTFFVYKIDSNGISFPLIQNVGDYHFTNSGALSFNPTGTRISYVDLTGLVELFDFNRNTGIISNPQFLEPVRHGALQGAYFSCAFSPNGQFLYISAILNVINQPSILYQYDLTSPNIVASRQVVYTFNGDSLGSGEIQNGPDGKIYVGCAFQNINVGIPYLNGFHNYVTDNISVINQPDSLGSACDFQPFSVNLGGNRTYYGLPNNPNYNLGPLDTLTAVHEIKNNIQQPNTLKIFYHPTWDIAFINADKLSGRKYTLSLFDITGKLIFKEEGNLTSQYFTKDINIQSFAKGVYIGVLQTEKEKLSTKFVK